jgi:hypothetical protein
MKDIEDNWQNIKSMIMRIAKETIECRSEDFGKKNLKNRYLTTDI